MSQSPKEFSIILYVPHKIYVYVSIACTEHVDTKISCAVLRHKLYGPGCPLLQLAGHLAAHPSEA